MLTDLSSVWFENPHAGQKFRILSLPTREWPGRFMLEYIYRPFTGETAVPAHYHPGATETFDVLAGQARYRLQGREESAKPGDQIVMPAGIPHVHPWSASDEPLHVRQTAETQPADPAGIIASLQAQITLFGLAAAGKVNKAGLPGLLQLAVLAQATMPATFLARPSSSVQRILFGTLAHCGSLLGYRTAYAPYGILTTDGLQS